MVSIKDNTVNAYNQVKNSADNYLISGKKNSIKILFLGNSITRHGPCQEIGWNNDWGMAASCMNNDYVHIIYSMLARENKDCTFFVQQASIWEREYNRENILDTYKKCKNFCPDIIVFRLGENICNVFNEDAKENLSKKILEFISFLGKKETKNIYVNCFWKNNLVDSAIFDASKFDKKGIFININDLGEDVSNMAFDKYEHKGVAMHPGDKGMQAIANRIYNAIINIL